MLPVVGMQAALDFGACEERMDAPQAFGIHSHMALLSMGDESNKVTGVHILHCLRGAFGNTGVGHNLLVFGPLE